MIIELFFFHGIKFAFIQPLMCIISVIHFQWTGEAIELP